MTEVSVALTRSRTAVAKLFTQPSHTGQLSLAIRPWIGAMSTISRHTRHTSTLASYPWSCSANWCLLTA